MDQNKQIKTIVENMSHAIPILYRWMLKPEADGTSPYSPTVAVLKVVKKQGPLPMSAIAQALSYSKQSLTVIVDQLEKDGLVERLPDPTDRRVSKIALTDKGKSLMARRKEALKNRISVDLSHLSQKDLEHLALGLEEIGAVLPKIQQV